MKGLICNAHLMLISLYIFGEKENWTRGKDVRLNINDDPTNLAAAIEGLVNDEEKAESAIGGFVDERSDEWEIISWLISCLYVMFLERFV